MPTPSDDTIAISDPRNAHTTCPPEERETQVVSRSDITLNHVAGSSPTLSDATSSPTPSSSAHDETEMETDVAPNAQPADDALKHRDSVEDNPTRDDNTHSTPSDESKDSDARLAHSMSAAAISPSFPPTYPAYPSNSKRFLPNSTSSLLRPGSKFHGTQQSDRQTYDVQVEIKQVDMEDSYLCGYLRIQGLTDDHPTLTTCFEGEIIGTKHTFKTAHPEWGSTEKVDMQHWARFPAWKPFAKQARSPSFTFNNFAQREHLFMRWKEYFLVPDHKVKSITGASFEGFYYICFNQCTGTVSGIYFHSRSEKYQQLELKHIDDKGCSGAIEFS